MKYDVVVIGGGASGLMCAATAAYRGRKVLLLEHTKKIGRKILMSGGGRCNFTHLHNTPANFLSGNAHFCKSALSRFSPADFVDLVDRHGVEYHEKTPGQLFCNESSKEMLQVLLTECEWAGVELMTETSVFDVTPVAGGYQLKTSRGQFNVDSLVVATGGLSIPNGGATGFAYDIAEQFGMAVTARQAALVPFTLQPDLLEHIKPLSGVSQWVTVTCNGMHFTENLLLTHRGLSGPAILQISSYWHAGDAIEIDLLPQLALEDWLKDQRTQRPKAELRTLLAQHMTKRLAQALCELWGFEGEVGQYSNARVQEVAQQFKCWRMKPSGTEGYRTAEVTLGGIETDEVSSKTFEAKKAPGLYFIGECLDVTGHLGGHNFQWAWASGFCAGQFV
ncbi:MAG: NAD(P)/FAD-dependent oxidoreductase [Oceanospirillales bacterium]|nr:NAD(P)/FAD-dependent oxidoreductase [Oceanospirillales bacterium]